MVVNYSIHRWARISYVLMRRPSWSPHIMVSRRCPVQSSPRIKSRSESAAPLRLYIPPPLPNSLFTGTFEIGPFGLGIATVKSLDFPNNGVTILDATRFLFREQIEFEKRNGRTEIIRIGSFEAKDGYCWFVHLSGATTFDAIDIATSMLDNFRVDIWYAEEIPSHYLSHV